MLTHCSQRDFSENKGKFRNTYRGKRVYVKPHTITREGKMLSITPHKAIYEENNNAISLSRSGYLTFDFLDLEDTANGKMPNYKEKDTFIMTIKNIGDFLKIDDTYRENEDPVILNYQAYGQYQRDSEAKTHVLKIQK